jgi:chorismate mutase
MLPLDPSREAEVVRRACGVARAEGIPEEGVRQIIWSVIDYCRAGVIRSHACE